MEKFEIREKEIFDTLKRIKNHNLVVVGGYAVNAYTLPRFSADCDIVVKDKSESKKIRSELMKEGYSEDAESKVDAPYHGEFKRYIKEIMKDFKVSIDILIREVLDRQTNATFSSQWIFENSAERVLQGKTISEELILRIITVDALFVMKAICCRDTDIRDVFMLISQIENKDWIRKEIKDRYDLNNRISKIVAEINSKNFRDGLQGVFGRVDDAQFTKQKELILKLKSR
ncbi:MAG: hypothetical protein KKD17_05910 [Nanoarchaeota archaeon]|nr:hypothetical protein [Nanoarchaeota archaeon]